MSRRWVTRSLPFHPFNRSVSLGYRQLTYDAYVPSFPITKSKTAATQAKHLWHLLTLRGYGLGFIHHLTIASTIPPRGYKSTISSTTPASASPGARGGGRHGDQRAALPPAAPEESRGGSLVRTWQHWQGAEFLALGTLKSIEIATTQALIFVQCNREQEERPLLPTFRFAGLVFDEGAVNRGVGIPTRLDLGQLYYVHCLSATRG